MVRINRFSVGILMVAVFCFPTVAWSVEVDADVTRFIRDGLEIDEVHRMFDRSVLVIENGVLGSIVTQVGPMIEVVGDGVRIELRDGARVDGEASAISVIAGGNNAEVENKGNINVHWGDDRDRIIVAHGSDDAVAVQFGSGIEGSLKNEGRIGSWISEAVQGNTPDQTIGVLVKAPDDHVFAASDTTSIENLGTIESFGGTSRVVGVSLEDRFATYVGTATSKVTAKMSNLSTGEAVGISGEGNYISVTNRGEISVDTDWVEVGNQFTGISMTGMDTSVINEGSIAAIGVQGNIRGIFQRDAAALLGEAALTSYIVNETSGTITVSRLLHPENGVALNNPRALMYGIHSLQTLTDINNRGRIEVRRLTTVDSSDIDPSNTYGIFAQKNANISNDGSIVVVTEGLGKAFGIQNNGADSVITIDGTIDVDSVKSSTGVAVGGGAARGTSVSVGGLGKIRAQASAGDVAGIRSDASGTTVNNQGHIDVKGFSGHNDGIHFQTINGRAENTGVITVEVISAGTGIGMHGFASGTHLYNEGRMEVTGRGNAVSIGMYVKGLNSSGTNSVGNIISATTENASASAATITGSNNIQFSNAGLMIATSQGSAGIITGLRSDSLNAQVTNSGLIEASSSGADAVVYGTYFTNKGTLNNSGSITALGGKENAAVRGFGNAAVVTVINSGSILGSVKNGIPAIKLDGGGNLELKEGSFVVGEMLLGGATSISIDADDVRSSRYIFGGAGAIVGGKPQVSSSFPVFYSADGREVATLDTRYMDLSTDILAETSRLVSGMIKKRASVSDDAGLHVWMSGSKSHNDDSDNQEVFVIGADGKVDFASNLSFGIFGGYHHGSVLAIKGDDGGNSYERKMQDFFGVVHGKRSFDNNAFLQVALSGGLMANEGVRFIQDHTVETTIDQANFVYDSYWLSPEITVGIELAASGDLTVTPSVNLRYTSQSVDAYTETDAQANASMGKQDIYLMAGRAELAVGKRFSQANITARGGLRYDRPIGDAEVMVSMLNGAAQAVVPLRKPDHYGIYGGIDVDVLLSETIRASCGGEVFRHDDDDMNIRGEIGLDILF